LHQADLSCKGSGDPFPLVRKFAGRTWLFAHNGEIKKEMLRHLIGNDYLKKNPPEVCRQDPLDAELFFIFLLKRISEKNGNVEAGLAAGIKDLYGMIREQDLSFSFILTDGQNLWAFRKKDDLFYKTGPKQLTTISSAIPDPQKKSWQELPENKLLTIGTENKW